MKCRDREQQNIAVMVFVSLIVYFLKKTRAVCPNINPMMLCAHIRDVNCAASYFYVDRVITFSPHNGMDLAKICISKMVYSFTCV